MNRIIRYSGVAIIWSLLNPSPLMAQSSHSAIWMSMAPQHTDLLVASRPMEGYVSFLGGFQGQIENTVLHPAQWLAQSSGETSAVLLVDEVFESFGGENKLGVEVQLDWLNVGVFGPNRRSFWSASVSEHVQAGLNISSDLLRLPFAGNANFELLDFPSIDLHDTGGNLSWRREYGLAWQHAWSEKWSSGIRLTVLQGIAHAQVRDNEMNISIDPESWEWTMEGGAVLETAGLTSLINSNGQDLDRETLLNLSNRGWKWDWGIQFRPTKRLHLHAQVSDWGHLEWSHEANTYRVPDRSVTFSGIELDENVDWADLPSDTIETWTQSVLDEWSNEWSIESDSAAYRQTFHPRWTGAMEFVCWDGSSQQGTLGCWARWGVDQNADWRLSYNHQVGSWVAASVSYGSRNGLPANFGAAMTLHLGPMQVFAALDNLNAIDWTRVTYSIAEQPSESIDLPTRAQTLQGQLGVTWRLGWVQARKARKKSKTTNLDNRPRQNSSRSPQWGDEDSGSVPCNTPGSGRE